MGYSKTHATEPRVWPDHSCWTRGAFPDSVNAEGRLGLAHGNGGSGSQNNTIRKIAKLLRTWLDAERRPLSTVVPSGWLEQAAFRPLPSDSDVMADPEAAIAAIQHVLAHGVEGSSASQLMMVDHVVRKKAGEVMRKWL